ncbi:UNVERIFIED_CONTAM: Eugenol O-methyltransferase [Sesamum calycinum]|uniref:Eugenol O-methyltransferase n=1 Tax=Sesamum calycinum TaxID=2727403 RepID=A0AAW2M9R5_9LAMI
MPISLSQLVHALSIPKPKSHFVHRLMRILIHSGFFIKTDISDDEQNERYWLTPASCLLLRNAPLTVAPLVPLILDPIFTTPFDYVSKWLASEHHYSSPFEMTHGTKLFELAGQELQANRLLNEAIALYLISHMLWVAWKGTNNLRYAAGDMFETIPSADAVFLKVSSEFPHKNAYFVPFLVSLIHMDR